jgi:transposase, IS30 family
MIAEESPIAPAARRAFSPSRAVMSSSDVPRWQPPTQCGVTSLKDVAADSTGRRNTSIPEVLVGRPAGWMTALAGRSPMKSPGAPAHRREVERQFWREIAKGMLTEEAALAVGVSQAVGSRWFRHRGGMPSIDLGPLSGRYLTFREREEIAILRAQGTGVREIARRLGRAPSTISRELRRNAATRGGLVRPGR